MNPSDSNGSVERYLDGRMSPMEEREFLSLVDGNPKLQQIISAESIVRGGIRRDRATIPTDHGATRALLLGKLGASVAAAGGAAGAAGHAAAAGSSAGGAAAAPVATSVAAPMAGAASTGTLGTILGGIGAKLAIAGVIAALSVGTYVTTRIAHHDPGTLPTSAVTHQSAEHLLPDTTGTRSEQAALQNRESGDTTGKAPSKTPRTEGRGATTSSETKTAAAPNTKKNVPASSTQTSEPAATNEPASTASTNGETQKTEVVNNGKVPMKVNFDRPR